jgi:hypothetical protein
VQSRHVPALLQAADFLAEAASGARFLVIGARLVGGEVEVMGLLKKIFLFAEKICGFASAFGVSDMIYSMTLYSAVHCCSEWTYLLQTVADRARRTREYTGLLSKN